MISDADLSRTVSHALRHEPSSYGLVLDADGWVGVQELLEAIKRKHPAWDSLDQHRLQQMVEHSKKRRHEIIDGRIRALYGHSTEKRLAKQAATPPELLFHGTDASAANKIVSEGLKPMSRQYVHLSVDPHTAHEVGARKDSYPVILLVRAGEAQRNGIAFYEGNESVWLADYIPPAFISRISKETKQR